MQQKPFINTNTERKRLRQVFNFFRKNYGQDSKPLNNNEIDIKGFKETVFKENLGDKYVDDPDITI
jgi:hypothetical protein